LLKKVGRTLRLDPYRALTARRRETPSDVLASRRIGSGARERSAGLREVSSMTPPVERKQWVLQVMLPDAAAQAELGRFLRDGGYAVLGRADRVLEQQLGTVSAVLGITRRELEVLESLATYDSSKEIARALSITVKTVDDHVERLLEKLEVHSRHRLILRSL